MNNEVGTYKQSEAKRDIAPGFRRDPIVAGHNRASSARMLGTARYKLRRGTRKALHYLRGNFIVPVELVAPVAPPVKFARKLATLPLRQLVRRQKKFARQASTAKHLLPKMSEGRLKSAVEAQQRAALGCFGQVNAEIKARALAAQGRLAETTE